VLSTLSSDPLETVADAVRHEAGRGPLWFQLYGWKDRGWWLELVRRAEAAGFEALVLTVDAPLNGVRDRERRAGFRLPAGLQAESLPAAAQASGLAGPVAQAPNWDDVAWLRSQTRLPLLLKGITHPQDAALAVSMGVAGLVVSNHGGRVLDTLPATAQLLPEVAQAVQGRCLLLVDGGLRRGTDILKALALGADAVLVGRPVLWGLAAQGASGAAQALRWLLDECLAAMALCGMDDLHALNSDILGMTSINANDSRL
jgi:4-hydroxymandelate oxidase